MYPRMAAVAATALLRQQVLVAAVPAAVRLGLVLARALAAAALAAGQQCRHEPGGVGVSGVGRRSRRPSACAAAASFHWQQQMLGLTLLLLLMGMLHVIHTGAQQGGG